ncbi:MAG: sialidase family protein [Clostridia bacterium]
MKPTHIMDLPPSMGNPRNSEGAFLALKDGSILFAYSKFIGISSGDDSPACICALISRDNGESFGEERVLAEPKEHGATNLMSVSLARIDKDTSALFYMVKHDFADARLVMRKSTDEGRTFGTARACVPHPGYFVCNNDRVVVLSNSRILVPCSYHRCLTEDSSSWDSFDGMGILRFFHSDDGGCTFRESRGFGCLTDPGQRSGLQEPGVVETRPGELIGWARTGLGCQYTAVSRDDGETWTTFEKSRFTSPLSPMSMKKIPGTDLFAAVSNPVPGEGMFSRNPLVLDVLHPGEEKQGRRWVLEEDREAGFCYTAMHFTPDSLLLAYCAGTLRDQNPLTRLRITKIKLEDIL